MKKVIIAAVMVTVALSMVLVACSQTEEEDGAPRIVIGTDATWPPMEFIDQSTGDIVGFDIDLMTAAAEASGFEVEFRNTGWDGIFAGLATSEYDAVMSSVTITDERMETMDFSVPYINAGQIIIVPAATEGVTSLEDLSGQQVGVQIGTTGQFAVQDYSEINVATYDEIGLAIEDLAVGRLDAVVADTPVAANYALQNEDYSESLKIVGEPFTEEFYGVAVRKGNTEVLELINSGLEAVLQAGVDEELAEKWLR
ncbi:MAG: basic amino acid ABC transporter substrate-binding protein [Spirochaeta sp.]|nr:basic amino acid ABC transporter substrate-binding protein [Spirochaeta sp.]